MAIILHVITDLDRGGAETMLYRLLSASRGSHQNSVVVSLRDRGHFGDKLESRGILVHTLGMRGVTDFPRACLKLILLMRRLKPDVVQTWLYHADFLGGLAAKFSGRLPVVWGIHTVNIDASSSVFTRVVRRLCARTSTWLPSTILCVARAALESHANIGYDRERMQVVPNGFDIPNLNPLRVEAHTLRASWGFEEHHQIVGCVGRFHPDKDYLNFLRGASLLKEIQPNVRFVLVGKNLSPSNETLMRWVTSAGLRNHVLAIGERNDIQACLLAMDVFCLPSQTEAFPLALGEAMAAARPVVTTDVGDAALLVGNTGIVVAPRDPERLCSGLLRMLQSSSNDRQLLGMAARRRIKREFSMTALVNRLQNVYSSACKQL